MRTDDKPDTIHRLIAAAPYLIVAAWVIAWTIVCLALVLTGMTPDFLPQGENYDLQYGPTD